MHGMMQKLMLQFSPTAHKAITAFSSDGERFMKVLKET